MQKIQADTPMSNLHRAFDYKQNPLTCLGTPVADT